MALYKYLARNDGSVHVLPTVHMCGDSYLSRKDVERANERVKRVRGVADKKLAPHGKYNGYSSEERRKYLCRQVRHRDTTYSCETLHSCMSERRVPESTTTRLKSEYLKKSERLQENRSGQTYIPCSK